MSESMTFTGGCLCGRCRWQATGEPEFAGYCFCSHCRRMSGAGRTPFLGFTENRVRLSGQTSCYEDSSDASLGIIRHFCPNCGTRLYSVPGTAHVLRIFYPGSLDDPERFNPAFSIHASSCVSWESVPGQLDAFEGDVPA
ncbi:GFA family protein [Paracoccus sp. S1E-3]|uniref:GFA family protein n=1 Tax=Paracoccus sp. S1E-3 TaxID=2756130 RepID=UPI0015EFBC22|nr:GFA family protein [Paracoccus sp. S1E-3]MBA4489922.1 GFA family protein [Paracoccus sp. S1E-3]